VAGKKNNFISFREPYPISDQNVQNLYPFSDQNGLKTIPFGAAHTYIPDTGEYPPPGRIPFSSLIDVSDYFRLEDMFLPTY